jgi:hypothetical protein
LVPGKYKEESGFSSGPFSLITESVKLSELFSQDKQPNNTKLKIVLELVVSFGLITK